MRQANLRREPDPGRHLGGRASCPSDVQQGSHNPRLVVHDPAVQGEALHPGRTRQVRDRERRDGRVSLGRGRERQVDDGLRRDGQRKDCDLEQRRPLHPTGREDRVHRGHPGNQPPPRELDPRDDAVRRGRARSRRQGGRRDRHVRPGWSGVAAAAELHRRRRGPRQGDLHDVPGDGDGPPNDVHDARGFRQVDGEPPREPADQHPPILVTALNFLIIQSHAPIGDSIVRRMKQIVELVGFEPETNELITNTVYEWDAATDTFVYKGHSFLFDEIMEMKNMTHEEMEAEFQRRVDIANYMLQKGMLDFREIAKLVVQYYQYPEETAKRVREEMGWQDHAVMKTVEAGGETVG